MKSCPAARPEPREPALPALVEIRDTLNEFAAGLHLEEEDLPAIFDGELLDIALRLEELVAFEFSASLSGYAVELRQASKVLLDSPSPEAMALVLRCFLTLNLEMMHELSPLPASCQWKLARQVMDVAAHVAGPKPAENQGFRELPRMLAEMPWMAACLHQMAAAADVDPARLPVSRGFARTSAKRWMSRANRSGEGQLCAALDHLQHGVEFRSRQVWFLRRTENGEPSAPEVYAAAHADVFPGLNIGLTEPKLSLEVAKLKGLALGLQLPEFALCFESAEWMANYALTYLLPPAPGDQPVRQASQLKALHQCRLSRWYFCAFSHKLEPLEMVSGVLRIGRPLFYERVAAYALMEYSLLQGIAFTRHAAPFYVDALAVMEREFELLFDGYLLRLLYYPRLKAPEGWCEYLTALHALHYGPKPPEELEAFRHVFLARRGLHSTLEILYRTVESHSALN